MQAQYVTYHQLTQGSLFRRNPVCAICWDECIALCDEYGGHPTFNLLESIEIADRLCRRLLEEAWTPNTFDYYYHRLERLLNYSKAAVSCACATVCLSLNLMEGLPEPLRRLANDMKGLLWGESGELYENMKSTARRKDITLSANHYGDIPDMPDTEKENMELKYENQQLKQQYQTMKQQLNQYNIGKQYNNYGTIYNAPVTINNTSVAAADTKGDATETEQGTTETERHFDLLTEQCRKDGRETAVEAELRSAANGSAQKLMAAIRTNEALGYLDTKNMTSQALYDHFNAYFGLRYKYQNFAKYRRD